MYCSHSVARSLVKIMSDGSNEDGGTASIVDIRSGQMLGTLIGIEPEEARTSHETEAAGQERLR